MELKDVIKFQLKRVNPFPGMMIDVDTWKDAHNYHRDQQRLHLLSFHGTGILGGLEVIANDPADLSVLIHPGISIDPEGNIIIVPKTQKYTLQTRQKGVVYLVIQFREVPSGPYQPPDGGQPSRVIEAYRIQEREKVPTEAYLELARIDFDPIDSTIRNSRNVGNPGKNEIDCRSRHLVETQTVLPVPIPTPIVEPAISRVPQKESSVVQETITVGHVVLGNSNKDLHRPGLQNLAREINRLYNFTVNVKDNLALDKNIKQCKLIYLTGTGRFELSDQEQSALAEYLKSGGTVFGEGCSDSGLESQSKGAKDFAIAFNQLAGKLKCKLESVQRGHSLLSSVHTFSQVPAGTQPGMLMEGGYMIYSGGDYGCAWQGGRQDSPLTRDNIRTSVEMGVNILIYAQLRKSASI